MGLPRLGDNALRSLAVGGGVGTMAANKYNAKAMKNVPALKFLKPAVLSIKDTYPIDMLSVAQTRIANGQFVPIMDGGISVFRPEILSIIDFAPIYRVGTRNRENNDVGDFVDIQYQASHLRQETLLKLIDNVRRTSPPEITLLPIRGRSIPATPVGGDRFREVRNLYTQEVRAIEDQMSYFKDILTNIDNIKQALEIKKIPASFYNTTTFLPLQQFFEKRMQYGREQFESFSDTKILLQLLFDFRAVLEGYSISLLDLKDPDRENDYSPVKIDKTYSLTNGFTFDLSNMRSVTSPVNATELNFFNQFNSSLPTNPDERIKILTALLGKEYLVSRGLGDQTNKRLLQGFGIAENGNPFDNIIGEVGNTIFEKPKGAESLASALFVDPGLPNASVLPFESKYVDSDDQKFVYVPGSAYFVDSVLSTNGNNWNTEPFVSFVNLWNTRVKDSRTVIENLLSLKNLPTITTPSLLNEAVLRSTKNSISTLTDPANINASQALIAAIFKLASTDNQLKSMLFQFCILYGMAVNSTTEQKEIFDVLARTEISDLTKLSHLSVPSGQAPDPKRGLAVIRPYLDQLAETIEKRITALTTKASIDYSRILGAIDLIQRVRPIPSSTMLGPPVGSGYNPRLVGAVGITGGEKRTDSTTMQIQRGNIASMLSRLVVSSTQNSPNFIKEFADLATKLYKASQLQGVNAHLLQDGTNRTRYNFLSTSTQLLMLFEIVASHAGKYSFANFERSNSLTATLVSIYTGGNKIISSTIDQLVGTSINFGALTPSITNPIKPSADSIRDALGIIRTSGGAGGRVVSSGGSTTSGRTGFSNSAFTQVTKELASLLQNSTSFNELLSTNPSEATSLKNIMKTITNTDLLQEIIKSTDKYAPHRASLADNKKKIAGEMLAITNFLHILSIIGTYMQNGSTKVQTVFNQTTLQAFLRTSGISNLNLLRNPSQVRTAAYILEDIKGKTSAQNYTETAGYVYNNLVVSNVVTSMEYRCLRSFLAEAPYMNTTTASPASNNRIKILSVGVPAGFSKELADRVNLGQISPNSFKDKEFDVININVYKRDARFDDLVFKPQKFLFDLSLFALEVDINRINPTPNESFSRMMLRAELTDMETLSSRKKVGLASINQNPKYDFLQNEEKSNLIRSHIGSYLLGLYTNFMTGIRISEDVFRSPAAPTRSLTPEIQQIVYSYLRDVRRANLPADQNIEQLLANESIAEDVKDVLRLFDYGSMAFNAGEVTSRVLAPKMFDRIFYLPLNVENFEIDLPKTLSTESGRNTWNQSYVQNAVTRRGDRYFLTARGRNDLMFDDFFVAIETANDKE